jgi:hypothetical protein
MILENVGNNLSNDTASHTRRLHCNTTTRTLNLNCTTAPLNKLPSKKLMLGVRTGIIFSFKSINYINSFSRIVAFLLNFA